MMDLFSGVDFIDSAGYWGGTYQSRGVPAIGVFTHLKSKLIPNNISPPHQGKYLFLIAIVNFLPPLKSEISNLKSSS
jgi:hypothetical protein